MKRVSFPGQFAQSVSKRKQLKMKENRMRLVWKAACHIGERVEIHRTRHSVFEFQRKEVNDMATIPKLIKAALDFGKALPEQVLGQGYAVVKGLTGNVNFTNIP